MTKPERAILSTIGGLLALAIGCLDITDATPPGIRWPIVALTAVSLAVVCWRLSKAAILKYTAGVKQELSGDTI